MRDEAQREEAEWAQRGMVHGAAADLAWLDVRWGRGRREAAWDERMAR